MFVEYYNYQDTSTWKIYIGGKIPEETYSIVASFPLHPNESVWIVPNTTTED